MLGKREKLFVSHDTADKKFVEEILPIVERAGRKYFFAPHGIYSGKPWRKQLMAALNKCDRILVVVSKESVQSEWVKTEVAYMLQIGKERGRQSSRLRQRDALPVTIEERDQYGAEIPGDVVDGSLIDSQLESIQHAIIPYNSELNRKLDPTTNEYNGPKEHLTEKQLDSIVTYSEERKAAFQRLDSAIRNPDGRIRAFLDNSVELARSSIVQQVAIASLLVIVFLAPLISLGSQVRQLDGQIEDLETKIKGFEEEITGEIQKVDFQPDIKIEFTPVDVETMSGERTASLTANSSYRFVSMQAGNAADSLSPSDLAGTQRDVGLMDLTFQPISENEAKTKDGKAKFVLRVTTDTGQSTERYVKFVSKRPTLQFVNGHDIATLNQDRPHEIEMSGSPRDIRVVARTSYGTLAEGLVRIRPRTLPFPKIKLEATEGMSKNGEEVALNDNTIELSILAEIEDKQTERTVKLVPQEGTVEIDLALNSGKSGPERVLLEEELGQAKVIPITADETVLAVRSRTRKGPSTWKYARLASSPRVEFISSEMYETALHEVYNRSEVVAAIRAKYPEQFKLWSDEGYSAVSQMWSNGSHSSEELGISNDKAYLRSENRE